ncbi:MAG TPA: PEP-CTERM sorting domain-containing protein [Longimicrobiales bacterium]|nr:PEP-CTERM sorting domain-containing protein [Longimicrobiales bacterium]
MRKIVAVPIALAGLALASPASAFSAFHNWNFCTQNSFEVCMDFDLLRDGATNDYQLTVTFVSSMGGPGEEGVMTAAGIYRMSASPDLDVSDVVVISPLTWVVGSGGLSGGGAVTFEVASNSGSGVTDGLGVGESVVVRFTSTNLATYNMEDLFARSHVQSLGPESCSIKPDSRLPGNLVDGVTEVNERCGGPTTSVPEPMTMVLLASGLLGVGAVRIRRRRDGVEADQA